MIWNIFGVLMSNVVIALVGVANSFIFPKILSIEDYALYNTYILYTSYVGFFHLGLPTGMFLNYAGCNYTSIDKKRYKSEMILLSIILAFFTAAGFIVAAVVKSWMIVCVSISVIPLCIVATYKVLFQAWDKFRAFMVINSLIPTAITVLTITLYFVFWKESMSAYRVITISLMVNIIVTIVVMSTFSRFVKWVRPSKIFSAENFDTMKMGFLVMIGDLVNVFFHTIDKQMIKLQYDTHSFAMYSFAMSMQGIMTLFISAISKPLYPYMARTGLSNKQYNILKELLFMFGALSGCAYYVCMFFVNAFIPKYTESIKVISVFFAVFPALSVISCLYINLYKINKKTQEYIRTLGLMLFLAFIMNLSVIILKINYVGISVATTIVYYIWLIYSSRHFEELTITKRDIIYLVGFLVIFASMTRFENPFIGAFVYVIFIILWGILLYGKTAGRYFIELLYKYIKR